MTTAYKYSMRFQYTSGVGNADPQLIPAGWTESFYNALNDNPTKAAFVDLCRLRANLLPNGAAITGWRIQMINTTVANGAAQTSALNLPGPNLEGNTSDLASLSMLFRMRSGNSNNVRSYRMACIPDLQAASGEYQPNVRFRFALRFYLAALNGSWSFMGSDLTVAPWALKSIDAAGNFVLKQAQTISIGSKVKVRGLKDIYGFGVRGGIYTVATAVNNSTTGSLDKWKSGDVYLGSLTAYNQQFYPIAVTETDFSRLVSRKVGKPYLTFRGRASKKRQNVPIVPVAPLP